MSIVTRLGRWRVLGVVALLLIALAATSGRLASSAPHGVATSVVTRGDLEVSVLATGTIEATRQVSVGTQATGEVKRLHVALGDTVRQGDLIAEIESRQQDNDLRRASAALAGALAELQSRRAAARQAVLALRRSLELVAADAGSRADAQAAEAGEQSARAAVAVAEAAVTQARLAQDTARVNVGYARVVAPMDGTVVAIVAEQGQTVNSVQTSPTLVKLARLDAMTVKAQVSEADVARVRPGMRVSFTLLGDSDTRYETTLRAIEPGPTTIAGDTLAATASNGGAASPIYYNGIFDVPNPQGKLRIAMTAQAVIVVRRIADALLVPTPALGARGKDGRYAVRVVAGGPGASASAVQERQVRIGANNQVLAQVLDGLSAGEHVVTSDAAGRPDGATGARP